MPFSLRTQNLKHQLVNLRTIFLPVGMAKPLCFKLKFTLPSFQLRRSKRLSTVPSIHYLSPMNPRAHDIGYPNVPAPPPSTPEHQYCMVSSPKVKSTISMSANNSDPNHAKTKIYVPLANNFTTKTNSPGIVHCESTFCKMVCDYEEKKVKPKGQTSVSTRTTRRRDLLIRNKLNNTKIVQDESESLLSQFPSFSDEFGHDEKHEFTVHNSPHTSHEPKKELIKVQKLGLN